MGEGMKPVKKEEMASVEDVGTMPQMHIEWWPIERPKPYAKNARRWSADAIQKIAGSIREFGWAQPIVCDSVDVIIIGHLRLAGARYLGLDRVPVYVADKLTPEQVKALRIADNRLHEESSWDNLLLGSDLIDLKAANFNLDVTGFETSEIVESIFGGGRKKKGDPKGKKEVELKETFAIILTCDSEAHQVTLLERFGKEGLNCRALIS
jgi:hypothetical protein